MGLEPRTRSRHAIAFAVFAALASGCAHAPPRLLDLERASHPAAAAQDYYKAAFQACLGPEHDLGDRATARRRLAAELSLLGPPRPGEPLIEPLPAEAAPEPVVRVNLRPLRARGLSPERLLDAMFAARPAGAVGRRCLARTWGAMVSRMGAEARALDAALAARGYPPVHHTEAYRAAYAPAYRVVPARAAWRAGADALSP